MRSRLRVLPFVFAFATFASLAAVPACGDAGESEALAPVSLRGPGGSAASVEITLDPFVVRILDARGNEVLRTLPEGAGDPYGSPGATRDDGVDNVKVLPGWDAFVPDEKPWAHGARATLLARTGTSASFELPVTGGAIVVDVAIDGTLFDRVTLTTSARGGVSTSSVPASEAAFNKTSVAFALRPDEHFFGLGERNASVDHRGLSMYSWAEEGSLGGGEGKPRDDANPYPNGPSMTYFPVPFFLSSAGYAMHLVTTYRTETHFGSERPDAWRAAVNDATLKTVIYVHDDPLASLDAFTRDTGRPFIPAPWVFGPRRRVSNGSAFLGVEEYKLLRQKKVPTTGLDDAVHFLPARSELGREDELRQWVENAHALGYKVMAYNNPYVSTSIDKAKADLEHGKANGYFAMTPEGQVGETFFISGEPQTLATIDLTKPEAVTWFQDLLRRTLALGYDGWMHDFGEYVRRPWKFADGRNGEAVHNEFPVLSAKAAHDLLTKEKPNDFLFFVRSGYTGTQQWVPAVWGGDPEATFDETQGIPAMLRGGLNLGMSGVPLWGSDVTGFKCMTDFPRDKEMYLRWAEVGAVSPIMMEQNACANPLGRREKWKLWDDEETIDVYGAMARLHTRLAPYFEVLARQAHETGVPIMRHPFLYHPREPEAWADESSFFLGPSLYASPVVARGMTVKDIWLPPGKWVDLVDLTTYEGGRRASIPAPLAKLPLLVRDGGIVPMLDASIETLAPATDPSVVTPAQVADRLDVIVALTPGRDARVVMADGTELIARRLAAGGVASGVVDVTASEIATCQGRPADQGCLLASVEGTVDRLRVTTPLALTSEIKHDDVELIARGPLPRRVRWDVLRVR
ncbi:MAG: glycoside hydrolase family 31 protein [Labilithrix sp.]|nr:glycoside hydrolase family 31 protein [Labilithrix sp.]